MLVGAVAMSSAEVGYYDKLFDCSDLTSFIYSIVRILPFSGSSESKFYICSYDSIIVNRHAGNKPPVVSPNVDVTGTNISVDKNVRKGGHFLTKVYFFYKSPKELYGDSNGSHTLAHADAEIKILTVLKRLKDKNITPCILGLEYSKICGGVNKVAKDCAERGLMHSEDDAGLQLCEYLNMVNAGLAYDKYAFLVLEMCDMTLTNYLHNVVDAPLGVAIFKSLLFQIVYTVYVIKRMYPGFHHYDLHMDNVMLKIDPKYKYKVSNQKYIVYTIDDVSYTVPYFGVVPKIIDFGFAMIPEEGIISNIVEDKRIMYKRSKNDLLFLFHHINYALESTPKRYLTRVQKILQSLEPNQSYVHYITDNIRQHEDTIPTYEQMVSNKVWNEYKHSVDNADIYETYSIS